MVRATCGLPLARRRPLHDDKDDNGEDDDDGEDDVNAWLRPLGLLLLLNDGGGEDDASPQSGEIE